MGCGRVVEMIEKSVYVSRTSDREDGYGSCYKLLRQVGCVEEARRARDVKSRETFGRGTIGLLQHDDQCIQLEIACQGGSGAVYLCVSIMNGPSNYTL